MQKKAVIQSAASAASTKGGCASSRLDHGLNFYVFQGGFASSRLISEFSDCGRTESMYRYQYSDAGNALKIWQGRFANLSKLAAQVAQPLTNGERDDPCCVHDHCSLALRLPRKSAYQGGPASSRGDQSEKTPILNLPERLR